MMMDDPNNPYRQNFEEPTLPAARPSNPLAIVGFILAFCVPPIGLLLSFIAVFRAPRAFAIAGLIIGAIGTAIVAVLAVTFSLVGPYMMDGFEFMMDTKRITEAAATYVSSNNNTAPADMGALKLPTDTTIDPWGEAYRLIPGESGAWTLSSAGIDKAWDTADDITITSSMDNNEIGEAFGKSIEAHFKSKSSAPQSP